MSLLLSKTYLKIETTCWVWFITYVYHLGDFAEVLAVTPDNDGEMLAPRNPYTDSKQQMLVLTIQFATFTFALYSGT